MRFTTFRKCHTEGYSLLSIECCCLGNTLNTTEDLDMEKLASYYKCKQKQVIPSYTYSPNLLKKKVEQAT